ncbi:hypothetical protein SAY86_008967 [Trapa natans]|uniref:PB1 domain-containing protein n=1 Tax=Trapa natans TaxID=22666 RepID=A0AAN7KDS6_TRANT|nr:hypothetical protein SAY86_008967 [Trapa natans]
MEPPAPLRSSDSFSSSPRSRGVEMRDLSSAVAGDQPGLPLKLRLMCSYGGQIVPRPHDKSLCYVGGETRIVVVDRQATSLSALCAHLSKTHLQGRPFTLKYQLPSEDLDSLITVSTDEDLENMIDEHDRTVSNPSLKPSRLRLFLFPFKPESSQSNGPILDSSTLKSDDWFINALNREFSSDSAPVNCLLGLEDEVVAIQGSSCDSGRDEKGTKHGHDVHSFHDSPMLETSSSFGSSSSSPSIANLPSIRVRAEEGSGPKLGMEDQFANMVVGAGGGLKQDESFIVLSSPPPQPPVPISAAGGGGSVGSGAGDYTNKAVSDDEKSDHGIPIGFLKLGVAPPQSQQKSGGGLDLQSPDSVSSDSSLTNVMSHQRPAIYQDQVIPLPSGIDRISRNTTEPFINIADPNSGIQLKQQIQDSGYALRTQVDSRQLPQLPQQSAPEQRQQPFIQAGSHYIHQQPAGAVPVTTYYSVYPPQQPHLLHHPQLDQQYPLYYLPVNQAQVYNLPSQAQQPNSSDSAKMNMNSNSNSPACPQTPPNPTFISQPGSYNLNSLVNVPSSKSEVTQGSVYRMATQPMVQQQYMGYSQIHHPSQSMQATSGGAASFAYDFSNPIHSQQIYYTQHPGPSLSSQYQTIPSVLPEAPGPLPTDAMKQQIRTSQAL